LERANFDSKRQILEFLDVRGKIAFESGEKVVYFRCQIDPIDQ